MRGAHAAYAAGERNREGTMSKAVAAAMLAGLCLSQAAETERPRAPAAERPVALVSSARTADCLSRSERYELATDPPFLFTPRCF